MMNSNMDVLNRQIGKQNKGFLDLNKTMKLTAGALAGAFAVKKIVAGVGSTLEAAGDLQTGMSKVATLISEDTNEALEKYNKTVTEAQLLTGQMTDVATNGLFEVISAYGESSDTADQFTLSMKAATAGSADVAETVKMISAVTKAYGDTSAKAQLQVADLAFKTVELGQTSFPELASSMGKVTSLSKTLGVEQTELFNTFATLTGVTGNTAEVSTQMAAILKAMLKPSGDMQKALENMGFASGDMAIEALGMQGTLVGLKDQVNGNAVAFANLFTRAEAKNAALALAGSQADVFVKKMKKMEDASGSMESAFEKRSQAFDVIKARSERLVEVLQRQLGLKALPTVNKALTFMVEHFDDFSAALDTFTDGVADAVTEAKELWTVISTTWPKIEPIVAGLATSITLMTVAMNWSMIVTWLGVTALTAYEVIAGIAAVTTGALGAAIAFITSPIGLVIIAIGLLVAGIVWLWRNWDEVTVKISAAWDKFTAGFLEKIEKVKEGIKNFFGAGGEQRLELDASVQTRGGKVPRFAKGVNNFGGGTALVGDGGPEFLNLPAGTDVTSVSKTAQLLGKSSKVSGLAGKLSMGGSTKQNVNIKFAPVINAKDATGVTQALSVSYEEFLAFMDRFKRDNEDTDFSFQG